MTEFHPACLALPAMAPDAFEELVKDIQKHGLIEPIMRMPDGSILDGRSRLNACERAAVVPRFETYTGNDPYGYVISKNINRRHLTVSQKAMAVAKLANLAHGTNQYTNKINDLVDDVSASSTSDPQGKLAAAAGIHRVTVGFGKRVLKKGTPNIIAMVEQGELSVTRAAEIVEKVDPAVQAEMTVSEAKESGKELIDRYPSNHEKARRARVKNAVAEALSMTDQEKLKLATKLEIRRITEDYEARIQAEVKERLERYHLPRYLKYYEDWMALMERRKGVMSAETFRKILACLHPDRVQDKALKPRYEEAFRLFNEARSKLLSAKDDPIPRVTMPTTVAEWDAMKRKATEARRHRRTNGAAMAHR